MSDEQPTVNFSNADLPFNRSAALFEEEQQAWDTLLAVSFEIKESLKEINCKLDVYEHSFSRR